MVRREPLGHTQSFTSLDRTGVSHATTSISYHAAKAAGSSYFVGYFSFYFVDYFVNEKREQFQRNRKQTSTSAREGHN